jgi:aromatic-L-amino-acid decarboxylase
MRPALAVASDADTDTLTASLLATVHADSRTCLTRTVLDGRPVIRFCIGQTTTEWRHVHEGWTAVRALATTLRRGARRLGTRP